MGFGRSSVELITRPEHDPNAHEKEDKLEYDGGKYLPQDEKESLDLLQFLQNFPFDGLCKCRSRENQHLGQ